MRGRLGAVRYLRRRLHDRTVHGGPPALSTRHGRNPRLTDPLPPGADPARARNILLQTVCTQANRRCQMLRTKT